MPDSNFVYIIVITKGNLGFRTVSMISHKFIKLDFENLDLKNFKEIFEAILRKFLLTCIVVIISAIFEFRSNLKHFFKLDFHFLFPQAIIPRRQLEN